jgi:hypothetical protein
MPTKMDRARSRPQVRRRWAAAMGAAALALLASGALFAQETPATLSIGLSPVMTALDLTAGETRLVSGNFGTGGTVDLNVLVTYKDAIRSPGGFEYQEPDTVFWSAGSWLEVNPQEFAVSPGERRSLEVTVSVPPGTPDGEYYAAFVVTGYPATGSAPGTTVSLAGGLTSLYIIAVGENILREAQLVSCGDAPWSPPSGGWFARLFDRLGYLWRWLTVGDRNVAPLAEGQPLRIYVPIANLGKTHIQPRVQAIISRGETVLRHMTFTGEIVLPGDVKTIELTWADAPLLGRYKLDIRVDYGGAAPLLASRTFALFPAKGVLGIVVMAFGLGYFMARRGRRVPPPTANGPSGRSAGAGTGA